MQNKKHDKKSGKKILVTGGAGYIGSHTIIELLSAGYDVVSIDNFSNSTPKIFDNIQKITGAKIKNYAVDICDYATLEKSLKNEKNIFAVIHFAAFKSVPESVSEPLAYYANNIGGMVNILQWCTQNLVNNFVFSSSCSVYGENSKSEVTEDTPLGKPFSPYAATKQMGEMILKDVSLSQKKLKSVALRYFNPAGVHVSGLMGGDFSKAAPNVIPIICDFAAGKRKGVFPITGASYSTRDGSCIRDYVHVSDIARAHVLAIKMLSKTKGKFDIINLGTGGGLSVFELLQKFEKVIGKKIAYKIAPAREGDVPEVYADNKKSTNLLAWKPKFSIEEIIDSAWKANIKKLPSKKSGI